MTNTKRYKARKRLCAVFLVCTAFLMCSMTSFAAYSFTEDEAVKVAYQDAIANNFVPLNDGDECETVLLAVEAVMPDRSNPAIGTLYVETAQGNLVFYVSGEQHDSGGVLADYGLFFNLKTSEVTFTGSVDITYWSLDWPENYGDIGYIYLSLVFEQPTIVNDVYVVKTNTSTGTINTASIYRNSVNILSDVGTVTSTVLDVTGSVAETISNTPLLLLMAVGLPVVSFGTGLLIRIFHRA